MAVTVATRADESGSIGDAIDGTKPIVDTRLRYEGVEERALPNDAAAATLRARLGFETGKVWQTALLVEGEFVWPLSDPYNSTTNGKLDYPVVADPESYEVNRLQLTNSSLPMTTVTLGRQRINLHDQRAALFEYGFRPFFLLVGWYALIAVSIWLWMYTRGVRPLSSLPPQLWHGHEMIYGVVVAAIAGFLLTAVPSWTSARLRWMAIDSAGDLVDGGTSGIRYCRSSAAVGRGHLRAELSAGTGGPARSTVTARP